MNICGAKAQRPSLCAGIRFRIGRNNSATRASSP